MTLHLTPSYLPSTLYGGPIISVSRLCESQVAAGMAVQVLTTTANGPSELAVPIGQAQNVNGVSVYYHRRYTKDHSHLAPGLWWHLWRDLPRAEYVHLHSWWNLVIMPALLLCRLRGRRVVLSPRGMLSPYTLQSPLKALFHRWVGRYLLRGAVLHATSEQEAQELAQVVPGALVFVAPNIIQLPQPGQVRPRVAAAGAGAEVFSLLFLSRIDPKKGLEPLFQALQACTFPWRLRLAGTGSAEYTASLQKLATELGISAQLEWLGWADEQEKYRLFAEADLFVLPSHNENFANVVIEALAVGTPVLLSPMVGLSAYVEAADLGWVCPNNPAELAKTLESAWQDRAKRARIQLESPERIQRDFNAAAVAAQYLAAYERYTSG